MKNTNKRRPNILLFLTDQQRTDTLNCYGSAFTSTPNIDRLAAEGTVFERAYCANPVCTPSRVSLMTGQHVSRHGVWNIGVQTPLDTPFISHALSDAGYRTHYVGKTHFQSWAGSPQESMEGAARWEADYYCRERAAEDPMLSKLRAHELKWKTGDTLALPSGDYYGFQTIELATGHGTYGVTGHYGQWLRRKVGDEKFHELGCYPSHGPHPRRKMYSERGFGAEAFDWPIPTRLHNSTWCADRAISFLENRTDEKPFFMVVGFQDPHHPHCVPTDFSDRVDPDSVPPPDYEVGELDDKPPFFAEARQGRIDSVQPTEFGLVGQLPGHDYSKVTPEAAKMARAYYHNLVRLIDSQVGRVLAVLQKQGLEEDTIVIFTSDHGELLGDHGLWMKGPFHYEQLIRIPLIIRYPRGGQAGVRISSPVSLVDLAPTLSELCDLPQKKHRFDGVSLAPILRGTSDSVRNSVMVECSNDHDGLRLKTIVTETAKLTWYQGRDFGELYDLQNDSSEKKNLWSDPSYARLKETLLTQLLDTLESLEAYRRLPRIGTS